MLTIPENEIHMQFVRSSGKGGQNVNKVSTKVVLHWQIGTSAIFSDEQKNLIRKKLAARITSHDELVISAEESRLQTQNREKAISKLHVLVHSALFMPKKRRATKPTKSSKLKRLDHKKKQSIKKQERRLIDS